MTLQRRRVVIGLRSGYGAERGGSCHEAHRLNILRACPLVQLVM